MRIRTILSLVVTLFGLMACVAPPRIDVADPQAVSAAISVQRDDFKKITNYKGPNASSDILDLVFLRAWKTDATGSVTYQIYVMDHYYTDWRFYSSAYDSNGNSLDTTLISRNVGSCSQYGCSHDEHLGLNVSQAYLENNQDNGIRFKVSGKAGEEIFFIPGGYIKAFLSIAK